MTTTLGLWIDHRTRATSRRSPGEAEDQGGLGDRLAAIEAADKMTDPQIVG
ncbi:MAG: hypothetical protein ABI672_16420 [Vicinamibacteria bacterium]